MEILDQVAKGGLPGWRCQACDRTGELQVHHIKSRSHSEDDAERNLIVLCPQCHTWLHGHATVPERKTLDRILRRAGSFWLE